MFARWRSMRTGMLLNLPSLTLGLLIQSRHEITTTDFLNPAFAARSRVDRLSNSQRRATHDYGPEKKFDSLSPRRGALAKGFGHSSSCDRHRQPLRHHHAD